jgi:hypothetical protein
MKGKLSRLLATVLLLTAGCGQADARPPVGPLAQLAVPPAELPEACRLSWRATPYALATTPVEEREFFEQILDFWFGSDSTPRIEDLDSGLSNVYSTRRTDHALVSLSLRFQSAEAAMAAAEQLRKRYEDQPGFAFEHSGRLLLAFSAQPEVPQACTNAVQAEVVRRAAGAA